jgi:hypothetical protein
VYSTSAAAAIASTNFERDFALQHDYIAVQQYKGVEVMKTLQAIDPRIAGAAVAVIMTLLETTIILGAVAG